MTEIRISDNDFKKLRTHVLSGGNQEEAALAMAGIFNKGKTPVFTVREVIPVENKDFQTKSGIFLQVNPEYLAWIIKRCRNDELAFVLAHSHPFSGNSVGFSGIDDGGETALVPRLRQRIPGLPHAFLVFGQNAVAGRYWAPDDDKSHPIETIKIVGERIKTIYTSNSTINNDQRDISETHHRQGLALGQETQSVLSSLHVAVVGVGGLGSQVFTQLTHLGIGKLTIIDDDILEESNRSRIIGSQPKDVGVMDKVGIMARYARECCPEVDVQDIKGNVEYASISNKLLDTDLIFCCTDNVRSRVVLNRISYQYYIPMIDTGIHLQRDDGGKKLRSGIGRAMLIHPDGPCLECTQIINDNALQREVGDNNRGAYVVGGGEVIHEPQVISINGVVASLAVTRLLDIIGGFQHKRYKGTYDAYRPLHGDIKLLSMEREVDCNLCSEVRGFADGIPLPCKIEPEQELK